MAKYHINRNTGEVGVCKAEKKPCPVGSAQDHFETEAEAIAARETKLSEEHGNALSGVKRDDERYNKVQEKHAKEVAEAIKERDDARVEYNAVRLRSQSDPVFIAARERFLDADERLIRLEHDTPAEWTRSPVCYNGVSFRVPKGNIGPNGSPLEISYKDPSMGTPRGDGIYVQTSAGIYISGPYKNEAEAEEGLRSYSGSRSPGRIGWD